MPGKSHNTTRHTSQAVILLLLSLLLVGCFGPSSKQLGREAQAQGNPEAAVRHYQRALEKNSRLATDADFMRSFNLAKRDAHVVRARRAISDDRWVVAVQELDAVLQTEPGYGPAIAMRRTAALGAADMFYRQAVRHADEGRLEAAGEAVDLSLSYNPAHLNALAARDILAGKPSENDRAQSLYDRAIASISEQRWADAERDLAQAVSLDPVHLPARTQRHLAGLKIRQADLLYDQARELDKEKRLDQAIEQIEQAKVIRPHHTGYDRVLQNLLARRTRAERLIQQAQTAITTKQWTDGLGQLKQVEAIFPYHPELETVSVQLKGAAAIDYTAIGRQHDEAGQTDLARSAYRDALRYMPRHTPAHEGLADIATRIGQDHETQGRFGHALLAFTQALEHVNDEARHRDLARAQAQIVERARFALEFTPTQQDLASARARAELIQSLQRQAPAYLSVQPLPAENVPRQYQASVHATLSPAVVSRIKSQPHEHIYDTETLAPNPKIGVLRKKMHHVNERMADLRHDRRDLTHRLRRLERQQADEPDNAHLTHKIRSIHRDLDGIDRKIDREAKRLHDLDHALSCEPLQITVIERVGWPYTVETHEKTRSATMRINLVDIAVGSPLKPIHVNKHTEETDEQTLNANPAIGLPHDPLRFSDDNAFAHRLSEACTETATQEMIRRVTLAETDRLRASADHLAGQGDVVEALEHRVTAAVLLKWTHPDAAQSYLDELRAAVR